MSRKRVSEEEEGAGVSTRSRVQNKQHQDLLAALWENNDLLRQLLRQLCSTGEKISNRVESVEESTINLEGYMEKFEVSLERLVDLAAKRSRLPEVVAASAASVADAGNSNSATGTGGQAAFVTPSLPFDTLNEKPF
jgi:hypothetical protein